MSTVDNTADKQEYWDKRSRTYNDLNWINNDSLTAIAREAGDYRKCLDLGCGSGAVLKTLISLDGKAEYVGIDISPSMAIDHDTYELKIMDLDKLKPADFSVLSPDLVTARMVMHHIADPGSFVKILHAGINKGTKVIVCEGVVPSSDKEVFDWYTEMFKYKEKRTSFTPRLLLDLFDEDKWDLKLQNISTENNHLNNWIDNAGIEPENRSIIYDMHANAPESVAKAYNFVMTDDGDILMDWKFSILTAVAK